MSNKPTINLWTPAEADLRIKPGVTVTALLLQWKPGGTVYAWQPGDVARLQIRTAPISQGGEVLAEAATDGTNPALFFDPSDNWIKWRLIKTTTAAWAWRQGFYDVDISFANGDALTLMTGLIKLLPEYTA